MFRQRMRGRQAKKMHVRERVEEMDEYRERKEGRLEGKDQNAREPAKQMIAASSACVHNDPSELRNVLMVHGVTEPE